MKIDVRTLFILCWLYTGIRCEQVWIRHNFDTAMHISNYPKAFLLTDRVLGYDGKKLYELGKTLYEQHNPSVILSQKKPVIPHIIHQIWIGGPVPQAFESYMNSWKRMNPDWEYRLWTDENIHELFPLYNQCFYDQTESMGVKSDLLKWEIIYRFGGIYVDVDFECLHSFDFLNFRYDFYTAYQPLDAFFVQLGAALYAASPGHPILKHCIETIKDDWHEKGAPKKSGPVHFSKSFMAMAGKDGFCDIAFPAFYFYPLGSQETILRYAQWMRDGAWAVHHWAKSWMPKNARPDKFRSFDNAISSTAWND